MSLREIAIKIGISHTSVHQIKKRHGLKTYKKQRAPKKSDRQLQRAKTRARKFGDTMLRDFDDCILMNDETYVKMDGATLPGPQFYTVLKGSTVSDEIKSIPTEKFGKKVLVWQAICTCGKRSAPYFCTGTINAKNYQNECLKKRILPMIQKHRGRQIFWPDLASAHYAGSTISFYESNNIEYVPKDMNPPNCPQLRPIERYWALIKVILRKKGQANITLPQLKRSCQLDSSDQKTH